MLYYPYQRKRYLSRRAHNAQNTRRLHMADLEQNLGAEVSRKSFLKTTGIGVGIAAGALVIGTGTVGAQAAPAAAVAESPFPYAELDPNESPAPRPRRLLQGGLRLRRLLCHHVPAQGESGRPLQPDAVPPAPLRRRGHSELGHDLRRAERRLRGDRPSGCRCRHQQDLQRAPRLVHPLPPSPATLRTTSRRPAASSTRPPPTPR